MYPVISAVYFFTARRHCIAIAMHDAVIATIGVSARQAMQYIVSKVKTTQARIIKNFLADV